MATKNSHERLIRDMESGEIPPLNESGILKKITIELEERIKRDETRSGIAQDKLVVNILKTAQAAVEERERAYKDDQGTLYSELCADQKIAIIDDIIRCSSGSWQAAKMIELFISERVSVEKIERIYFL